MNRDEKLAHARSFLSDAEWRSVADAYDADAPEVIVVRRGPRGEFQALAGDRAIDVVVGEIVRLGADEAIRDLIARDARAEGFDCWLIAIGPGSIDAGGFTRHAYAAN